jgi:hypothetical protein
VEGFIIIVGDKMGALGDVEISKVAAHPRASSE